MTPTEIESRISGLEASVRQSSREAQAATARANDALKFIRDMGTGMAADIPGCARDVSNSIDVKYGKL
ncbi:MAG TPA: hypothetical protein VN877_08760 [Opitutaceae bacterium]|nr:hypothetical protein [Opitutaceae bacterium]